MTRLWALKSSPCPCFSHVRARPLLLVQLVSRNRRGRWPNYGGGLRCEGGSYAPVDVIFLLLDCLCTRVASRLWHEHASKPLSSLASPGLACARELQPLEGLQPTRAAELSPAQDQSHNSQHRCNCVGFVTSDDACRFEKTTCAHSRTPWACPLCLARHSR